MNPRTDLDNKIKNMIVNLDHATPAAPDFDDLADRTQPSRQRRMPVVAAAAALVALGVGGLALNASNSQQPATANAPTNTLPAPVEASSPPTTAPIGPLCDEDRGCAGFDALVVADGISDYYVGPASLGEPRIDESHFRYLTRCVELDTAGATCTKIEGIAGVGIVDYPSDVPVDTSVTTADANDIEIGTVFTDISPEEYSAGWAAEWGSSAIDVRGTTAIAYRTTDTTASLIWTERPGVLVWIQAPLEREAELPAIAEGLQLVDGPETIPSRLVVAGTGEPYDASSNDGDAMIVGKRDGTECTGWAYIDDCSNAIADTTYMRTINDEPVIVGAVPADVASVVVRPVDGEPVIASLITVEGYETRFFQTAVETYETTTVEWLDPAGVITATTAVEADPLYSPDAFPGQTSAG